MRFVERIGALLVPLARCWIRHANTPRFKQTLWNHFSWRRREYRAKTVFGATVQGISNDLVQGYIYYFGTWEPNLTRWIAERLSNEENRVFVDVGANIGYFSLLAASAAGGKNRVVSVEASPDIYRRLVRNIRLNQLTNVRTVCCAATASDCQVTIYAAPDQNMGATTILTGRFEESTGVRISGRPLAEILSQGECAAIRLVKIDVEGAELAVIEGFLPSLSALPQDAELVIEVSPERLGSESVERLFSILEGVGFFAYSIRNSYDPREYLFSASPSRPSRLSSRPSETMDVVFSKVDVANL